MPHDWLIREIEALRDYARMNGLSALSEHLDQARLLAQTEIASRQTPGTTPAIRHIDKIPGRGSGNR